MFVVCYFCRVVKTETTAGNQIEQDVRKWLSPPDPSTNHNAACDVYHNVPPTWFFKAAIFKEWMSKGTLLWVHGKREFLSYFARTTSWSPYLRSRVWEEHH